MDNQQPPLNFQQNQFPPTPPASPLPQKPKKSSKLPVLAGGVVALLLVVGFAAWGIQQSSKVSATNKRVDSLVSVNKNLIVELDKRKTTTGEENIDKNAFQAVFLTNNQVYFGKITEITETQVTLTNIYYLKQGNDGSDVNSPNGDVSLVKLGNELHGPQDTMFIERREVNFWENLKADGKVSKAIVTYEQQNPTSK